MIVDFHTHILPAVDDGSASVRESIKLLRMEAEQGVKHVVLTPHFYPRHNDPEKFLQSRKQALRHLLLEVDQTADLLPQLSVGAEVYFFKGMSDSSCLKELTIDESGYILVEMPPAPWSEHVYAELIGIWEKQGLTPIIAHIDRYIRPFATHGIPKRLAELPVLVQANASFFLQSSTRRLAMKLLKQDQIQLLGSDCHNMTTRKPNLGEALEVIEKKLGMEAIQRIEQYQDMVLGC